MTTIVENLKQNLIDLKKELDRRQNVYAWGGEEWKRKNKGGILYKENIDILKESIIELTDTISNLELLTPNKILCTQI